MNLGIKLNLMDNGVHVGIVFRPHVNQQYSMTKWPGQLYIHTHTHTMSTFSYSDISSITKYVFCHSNTSFTHGGDTINLTLLAEWLKVGSFFEI